MVNQYKVILENNLKNTKRANVLNISSDTESEEDVEESNKDIA